MKLGMKTTAMVFILALSLVAGTATAQNETTATYPHQQMSGNMMQGRSGMGMMGGNMMRGQGMMMQGRMGCMEMMGQGIGSGMMGGGMMKNMSAENQQKFMDATKELRKKMHMLHFEHMEAMRNPKATLEDLADLEQKMFDIRKEMMQKAREFKE